MATSITPNSRSFPSGQVFYTWVNIRCKNLPWVGQDSVQINRNATLLDRYAHQLLLVAETALSKRSRVYVQAAYRWAGGQDAKAWINGATGQSGSSRQMIAGAYVEHRF
jgi:hypothetical protein